MMSIFERRSRPLRLAVMCLSLAAASCQSADQAPSNTAEPAAAVTPSPVDAKAVFDAFRAAKLPVIDLKVLSEATDDNHLLGRPRQYTSKVFFYDSRHPKGENGEELENTIEVFSSTTDAKERHDYVEAATRGIGMLTQYMELHGNVLVRFNKVMLPSEVTEYRKVLELIGAGREGSR